MTAALASPGWAQNTVVQKTVTETTVTEKTVNTPRPNVITELEFQPASRTHDIDVAMLRDFQNVKEMDPAIATQLARNPALVQKDSYVERHPSLEAFLDKYPNARDELQINPGNFLVPVAGTTWNSHEAAGIPRDDYLPTSTVRSRRARAYSDHEPENIIAEESSTVVEKRGNTTTELQFKPASTAHDLDVQMLRDFGMVKESDPAIANDLAKNPSLIADRLYVVKHPALQAFLLKHPDAREELQVSPGNFLTPVAGSKWNSHEAAGIPRDANGN
jgi:hypothetical protein